MKRSTAQDDLPTLRTHEADLVEMLTWTRNKRGALDFALALVRAEIAKATSCTECNGRGTVAEDTERGGTWIEVPCDACKGIGRRAGA